MEVGLETRKRGDVQAARYLISVLLYGMYSASGSFPKGLFCRTLAEDPFDLDTGLL